MSYCGVMDIMYQLIVGHGEWASPMVEDRRIVGDWSHDETTVITTKNMGAWGLCRGPLCACHKEMVRF